MIRALLTEADQRATLAAVRSLGQRGVRVHIGGQSIFAQSFFSRYCAGRVLHPSPKDAPEQFHRRLLAAVASGQYDVLLPMHEYSLLPISRHRESYARHVPLALPEHQMLSTVRDKRRIVDIAAKLGISTPRTYDCRNEDELEGIAQKIQYPCVVKPRTGMGATGVRYPGCAQELRQAWRDLNASASDTVFDYQRPLIQEYIPGELFDVDVLFCHGEPRVAVVCHRITTYPITGGRSLIAETIKDAELQQLAIALLRAVRWHGPAGVEFKRDHRDGRPTLMEVNPRLSGAHELVINAGVDLPYLTCLLALHGDIEPITEYQCGVRHRWWFPYELAAVLSGDGGLASLSRLLRFEHGTSFSTTLTDPLPHLAQILDVTGRWLFQ